MNRRNKSSRASLILSLGGTATVLAIGLAFIDGLTPRAAVDRLVLPILDLIATIAAGLIAGQVIEAAGWTRRLAVLARPLFRFGRLGDRCAAAFMAAFVSGVAANAMLLDFYKEGAITRRQLYLTNFVNQLPAFFLHLPTTFFIVTSMTGTAGVLYFVLTFLAAAARTLALLAYGRLRLAPEEPQARILAEAGAASAALPWHQAAWRAVGQRFPARMLRICTLVVPIYTGVFLLNRLGFFNWVQDRLAQAVVTSFVPIESLSIVVLSFVAEFTSGFAAAGALMDAGVLTTSQTVLALLTGNVLAFPLRALRHQLPHYMGIFSPRMGAELLVLGQLFRVGSIVAAGFLYYLIAGGP
jgi:hypothetical protein